MDTPSQTPFGGWRFVCCFSFVCGWHGGGPCVLCVHVVAAVACSSLNTFLLPSLCNIYMHVYKYAFIDMYVYMYTYIYVCCLLRYHVCSLT